MDGLTFKAPNGSQYRVDLVKYDDGEIAVDRAFKKMSSGWKEIENPEFLWKIEDYLTKNKQLWTD